MTREQAIGVIKFEIACVNRQDTSRCTRDCKKCDLCLPTEDVLKAYVMAIKALEQIDKVKKIINANGEEPLMEYIKEDAVRYQMISEVLKNEK